MALSKRKGVKMFNGIDYRSIAEQVAKTLPGEVVSQETPSMANGDTTLYTTTRSNGNDRYTINGESWTVKSPTVDNVTALIDRLFAPGNYFAIFMALGEDVADCAYVQTAVLEDDDQYRSDGKYMVESQFWNGYNRDEGANNIGFQPKHYRKSTDDIDEIKKIFEAFASGNAPDVTSWKDVTAEIHIGQVSC
jgi:hypothetical protein